MTNDLKFASKSSLKRHKVLHKMVILFLCYNFNDRNLQAEAWAVKSNLSKFMVQLLDINMYVALIKGFTIVIIYMKNKDYTEEDIHLSLQCTKYKWF